MPWAKKRCRIAFADGCADVPLWSATSPAHPVLPADDCRVDNRRQHDPLARVKSKQSLPWPSRFVDAQADSVDLRFDWPPRCYHNIPFRVTGRLSSGGVAILLVGGNLVCTRMEPMLRVDRVEAMTPQLYQRAGVLTGRAANEMLAQFITGTQLRIRTYWGASCERKNLTGALIGFTTGWHKVETGED